MKDVLNGHFSEYAEELYSQWQLDPSSVSPEWQQTFEDLTRQEPGAAVSADTDQSKQSRVNSLVWAYRDVGYIYADINPLGSYATASPEMKYQFFTIQGTYQSLELSAFGLGEEDLNTRFYSGGSDKGETDTLDRIISRMKQIYCGSIGYDYLHIKNKSMRGWLTRNIEARSKQVSDANRVRLQKDLIKAEEFERFIHTNFIGQKRFSLEGAEALIPAIHYLIQNAANHDIREVVLGMAHRGRLNVFTNAMRKPAHKLFAMFQHQYKPHDYGGSGDVKYHLGQSFDYVDRKTGKKVHLSLAPNPSHLEAVDPVVVGKTRGVQRRLLDFNRKKVIPVLIHGESAFSGQGIVSETFNLSQLKGYKVGGTIHVVVNNQIGFTTSSRDQRSTYFATDIAKTINAPILHVNGDDPEAVVEAMDLAIRWRQKFGFDVVVDIICYRRLGHNEADEPSFTHPRMYDLINNHDSVRKLYGEKVAAEGIFSKEEQESFKKKYIGVLKGELKLAGEKEDLEFKDAYKQGHWVDYAHSYSFDPVDTTVDKDQLYKIAETLTTIPEGFNLHPKLVKFLKGRQKMIEAEQGVDWAFAEAMSMGTLLMENFSIRFSGEDCARGTFSQRHSRWWDVRAEKPTTYVPLMHLDDRQANISVFDSPLSEFSVLGFEYGYSLTDPRIMVVWEAQFGDFANGAQVIIDQFIAAGETKWFRSSGLVLLLPHGYEGQGPEHSSAHLERYLQHCADENWQICNVTTPAQYFHLLRRQMKQPFRKPLIVMTPKSLLRSKHALSSMEDLYNGSFSMVLDDPAPPENPERLILCSGKIVYDLQTRRTELDDKKTLILRLEQLYPFPCEELKKLLKKHSGIQEHLWVQEEPRNRGGWFFVDQMLREEMNLSFDCVVRPASASPATGSFAEHQEELETILTGAFNAANDQGKRTS